MVPLRSHPRKILIASDDEAWLGSVSRAFMAEGYTVRTTRTGQSAFDLLQTERFDAALLAVDMPKMSGLEALKQVRKSHYIANLPVLLIGSEDGVEMLRRVHEAGGDDYVRMPAGNAVLLLRTALVLARAERMDPLSEASITGRFSARVCAEIFQLFNRSKRTGLLRVVNGPSVTSLWFDQGEVVFARDDTDEGVQAVYNLVRTTDARFEFIEGERPPAKNITRPFMFLILEFARKFDTYVASRRKTIEEDLVREEKRLDALAENGAKSYLPDLIENSRKVIESVRKRLADRLIERAYESVRKLRESIDWMELELERLKHGETATRRSSARRREVHTKPAFQKESAASVSTATPEPKTAAEAAEAREVSAPTEYLREGPPAAEGVPEAAAVEAEATVAQEEGSRGDEPGKQPAEEDEERIDTREILLAGLKVAAEENGDADETFAEKGAVAAVMETSLEISPTEEILEGGDEKPSAEIPRLIQRFPPDVVEMMQAELAKDEPPLSSERAFRELAANVGRSLKPRIVSLESIKDVLSEAFYSRANVLSVVVAGRPEELAEFFTRATERVLEAPDEESAYLIKVLGGLDHTLYIVGMIYDVMDSFEAENILDRCMGAVLLGAPDETAVDITVDALSLALVKYHRSRVFVTGRGGSLPRKVGLAFEQYSFPPENRRLDFEYTTEAARGLLLDLVSALHRG